MSDQVADKIIVVYGHLHAHEDFRKFVRGFRDRHPNAIDTPELAEIRFYNYRYNPKDKDLVEWELGLLHVSHVRGLLHKIKLFFTPLLIIAGFKKYVRSEIISKYKKSSDFSCSISGEPLPKVKKIQDHLGGEFSLMVLAEKEDCYEWSKSQ